MKAEVLDCRWYLFVCWLHMFGFGFRGFAGFPPGRTDTLHSPANTLAGPLLHTHLGNVWNIKQGGIFGYHISNIKIYVKNVQAYQLPVS